MILPGKYTAPPYQETARLISADIAALYGFVRDLLTVHTPRTLSTAHIKLQIRPILFILSTLQKRKTFCKELLVIQPASIVIEIYKTFIFFRDEDGAQIFILKAH